MGEIKLSAKTRSKGEKIVIDYIPAVIYGKGIETQSLNVKRSEFDKTFKVAGESNLINLEHDGQTVKVLIKDIQRDVVKNFVTHIDFYQVNMSEKIKTEIPLHFIGESKAIKELGGTLIKDMDTVEVECLPGDLVDHIDVDISVLNTFDDAIRQNDLTLPKGLELISETNEMIAAVREPKVEVEETPVATEEGTSAEEKTSEEPEDSDKK